MKEVQEVSVEVTPQPYQAPRVEDLGAWQAVTLLNSYPINPGGIFDPSGMGSPDGQ